MSEYDGPDRRDDVRVTRERHFQTLILVILTAVLSVLGTMIHSSVDGLRQDVAKSEQRLSREISDVKSRLIEVEKKLEAVTVSNITTRKSLERHLDDERRHQ